MGLGRMVLLVVLWVSNIALSQQVAKETATRDADNQSREASKEECQRFLGIWQLIASEGLKDGQTEERIEVKEGDVYWVKEGGVLEQYRQKPYSQEGPRWNPYRMPRFKLMVSGDDQEFVLRVEGAVPQAIVRIIKKGDEELLLCEAPNAINLRKKLGVRFVLRRLKEIPRHLIDRQSDLNEIAVGASVRSDSRFRYPDCNVRTRWSEWPDHCIGNWGGVVIDLVLDEIITNWKLPAIGIGHYAGSVRFGAFAPAVDRTVQSDIVFLVGGLMAGCTLGVIWNSLQGKLGDRLK